MSTLEYYFEETGKTQIPSRRKTEIPVAPDQLHFREITLDHLGAPVGRRVVNHDGLVTKIRGLIDERS